MLPQTKDSGELIMSLGIPSDLSLKEISEFNHDDLLTEQHTSKHHTSNNEGETKAFEFFET
jgi:hypothetical protein